MSLKKKYLKSKPEVKVTFEVNKEAAEDAAQAFLLAEFNDWQPVELKKLKNGCFKAELSVPTDQQESFEFKYRFVDESGNERFDNDWEADAYRPNALGSDNSVLLVQSA